VSLQICCSSPERFLKGARDGTVEARPIKGTARRYVSPELDQQSKDSLLSSAKARAENLMIVDLLRNDLGRFCKVALTPQRATPHLMAERGKKKSLKGPPPLPLWISHPASHLESIGGTQKRWQTYLHVCCSGRLFTPAAWL